MTMCPCYFLGSQGALIRAKNIIFTHQLLHLEIKERIHSKYPIMFFTLPMTDLIQNNHVYGERFDAHHFKMLLFSHEVLKHS